MTTSPTPSPAPLSAEDAVNLLRAIAEATCPHDTQAQLATLDWRAADLIDTLTARVAELETENRRISFELIAAKPLFSRRQLEARATQAEAERDALRKALIRGINEGTDGFALPCVSSEFLRLAPDEFAAVKGQRDAAQEALADLLRLTGTDTPAAAVSVVATLIAGADASAYGGVVRAYGEVRAALAAAEAREQAMHSIMAKLLVPMRGADGGPLVRMSAHYEDGSQSHYGPEAYEVGWRAIRAALSAGAQQAQGEPLVFTYTNWRGEHATRRAIPIRVYHGATEYHPEPQWLMEAHDVDKDAVRVFAMRDMGQAQGGDIARELAEALDENWQFLAVWAQQYGRDACGGKMHRGHAEMLARVHSVMTKAYAAGLIKENTTTRLPALIAEAGHDVDDLLAARASGLLPTETREGRHEDQ